MVNIEEELKILIIKELDLEDISPADINAEEALFVDGLGLDSIDALELGIALQKKYNIKIKAEDKEIKKHFFSVKTIAEFVSTSVAA